MGILSIDLGTTNIKVAVYDDSLNMLAIESNSVDYLADGDFVEFDAEEYFQRVVNTLKNCCQKGFPSRPYPIRQIVLTGQAESLVLLDKDGIPLRNGISWLDMRSREECSELKTVFNADTCYRITGQPEIIPTWPITKILWVRQHEPEIFSKVAKYLLLKDYIQYRLTGIMAGEYSIYNFSHYFNITAKAYWQEILTYCGVLPEQLPPLVEPCTILGSITKDVAAQLGLEPATLVNVGTLDHFSGMIGTGNITEGVVSESTGTVLAIATLINQPLFSSVRVPCHYGPFKDTYVLLPVCESGGISLEWYRNCFVPDCSYAEINEAISKKSIPNDLIFLPYLTGSNAPEFNSNAKGVFYGIKTSHDKFDFALAVMEGVAHLLKKNLDYIEKAGIQVKTIISTGGGARSEIWSQMKADITEHTVAIPENEEAACLGSAMIGAVSEGLFADYAEAVEKCVVMRKKFTPRENTKFRKKHILFNRLFKQVSPLFEMDLD